MDALVVQRHGKYHILSEFVFQVVLSVEEAYCGVAVDGYVGYIKFIVPLSWAWPSALCLAYLHAYPPLLPAPWTMETSYPVTAMSYGSRPIRRLAIFLDFSSTSSAMSMSWDLQKI